ncbi:MAG: DNA repair protein RadA [Solirubrobacterales bacterium]
MKKEKTVFVCQDCGALSQKWVGRCPACGAWNSMNEQVTAEKENAHRALSRPAALLSQLAPAKETRFPSGNPELDCVLGGGIIPGSLVLIGGDPGIGKSTLLLQMADAVSQAGRKIMYLSGEESAQQIKLRADRMGLAGDGVFLVSEPDLGLIDQYIEEIDPSVVIIDSIQTVYVPEIGSTPGSIAQLRESAARLMELAKRSGRAVFLVGHVTKEGALAGPKVLEHMVDTVIYFEGDRNNYYRILRAVKNRYGPVNEVGILEMSGSGLNPVDNPSRALLGHRGSLPGLSVVATFEGTRAILVEIEALVAPAGFGNPRRMAAGIDGNRLALIAAVLEKRCGLTLAQQDIYLKVAGGVVLKDPAVDLGIAVAIASSFRERKPPDGSIFIGEIGLSGDIRPVPYLDMRLKEAEKMGLTMALIPAAGETGAAANGVGLETVHLNTLDDVLRYI